MHGTNKRKTASDHRASLVSIFVIPTYMKSSGAADHAFCGTSFLHIKPPRMQHRGGRHSYGMVSRSSRYFSAPYSPASLPGEAPVCAYSLLTSKRQNGNSMHRMHHLHWRIFPPTFCCSVFASGAAIALFFLGFLRIFCFNSQLLHVFPGCLIPTGGTVRSAQMGQRKSALKIHASVFTVDPKRCL